MSDPGDILLALVSIDKQIVAEYRASDDDFAEAISTILSRIPPNDSKLSYSFERNLYHYISKNQIVYLCVAREKFGRRIPFSFLKELKSQFLSKFPDAEDELLGTNENYSTFDKIIEKLVNHYKNDPSVDQIRKAQGEINQVKDIMVQNIERVLERGDRIDMLVDKTNNLSTAAFSFRKRSTAVKRRMWWRHQKILVLLVSTIAIIFYMMISFFCGFPNWSSCRA
ncbi:hypothetical protein BB560_001121 [Smittium megazygosporum]|uniref:Synaptobrevin homolog YKT6 n=1 Tax=Smittium megazygosporum TaxID=133381 RepID=A0A2T9ZIF6_9FUNG|nr:hypothetical protein BB560_001121 [Smittium megazygosporum]